MEESKIRKVSWSEIISLTQKSARQIKEQYENIDTIISLARGGLWGSAIISHILNVKRVYSFGINFYSSGNKIRKVPNIYQALPENFWSSNILIVDDIIDSGRSIKHVLKYIEKKYYSDNKPIVYCAYFKLNKCGNLGTPTFYGECLDSDEWLVFPWEI